VPPTAPLPNTLLSLEARLRDLLGSRCTRSESERERHGRGEGRRDLHRPDLVVFPHSTDEVAAIVRACAEARVPVVPFGAGSSLEGHVAAMHGGVCVDLAGMQRIVRTSVADLDITVEAGVTRRQLVRALEGTGTTFFIDPGADATIGGMLATGASGTTTVRYGTMRENVLGLTVVLADGRVIRTGGRARKSSAGYDLTRLFTGSEGTLGIITEATLRLHPVPDAIAALVVRFDAVDAAVETVVAIQQCALPLARMELLDAITVRSLNAFLDAGLPEAPLLFLEIHAASASARDEQLAAVRELVDAGGGAVHDTAVTETDRHRLWEARHRAFYAGAAARPGADVITTDVCVPISALPACIAETRADLAALGLTPPLVGHVGDGNFHLLLHVRRDDPVESATIDGVVARLTERALRHGGTCTGEHGVGLGKRESLRKEHGAAVEVMRAIKQALDPLGLLNPGKVLPDEAVPAGGVPDTEPGALVVDGS
jgi:D-lactate dehydrogenase (cytochrome)